MIYSGATREHLCDRLNPGCFYRFRVYCISDGGQSAVILSVDLFGRRSTNEMKSSDSTSNIEVHP